MSAVGGSKTEVLGDGGREGGRGGMGGGDGLREGTGERQRSMGIRAELRTRGGETNPRKEPRFGCREGGQGERRRMPREGRTVSRGTGDGTGRK